MMREWRKIGVAQLQDMGGGLRVDTKVPSTWQPTYVQALNVLLALPPHKLPKLWFAQAEHKKTAQDLELGNKHSARCRHKEQSEPTVRDCASSVGQEEAYWGAHRL